VPRLVEFSAQCHDGLRVRRRQQLTHGFECDSALHACTGFKLSLGNQFELGVDARLEVVAVFVVGKLTDRTRRSAGGRGTSGAS
jgi:hypothetical protein